MTFKRHFTLRKLVRSAVIACIYTVICLMTAEFSFAAVQVRLGESLAMLSVFSPEMIIGVTVGCFISNMLASAPIDMLVGTAATLISAILTYNLRNVRTGKLALVPSIPPVVINAVVIGIEVSYLYYERDAVSSVLLMNILLVGLGQFIACSVLGVLLVLVIEKNPTLRRLLLEEK